MEIIGWKFIYICLIYALINVFPLRGGCGQPRGILTFLKLCSQNPHCWARNGCQNSPLYWVIPEKIHTPPPRRKSKITPSPPSDILEWFVLPPSPDVNAQNYPLPFGHLLFLNFSKGYLAV